MDFGGLRAQVGSPTVTNIPLLWGLLIMGEAMYVCGEEAYGKPLYLSLNFAANLKLL